MNKVIKCEICKKEYNTYSGLGTHLSRVHNIKDTEEYYLQYIGEKGYCKVCGKETLYKGLKKGYQKYCGLKCSNNDPEKIKLVSEMRKSWWKTSDKVKETKDKISNTISLIWKDELSIYNNNSYRYKLSNSTTNRWNVWRNNELKQLCDNYGVSIINDYTNAHQDVKFKCNECGTEYTTKWNYIQSGKLCPNLLFE